MDGLRALGRFAYEGVIGTVTLGIIGTLGQ